MSITGPPVSMNYREGTCVIIGKSDIQWGPWKDAEDNLKFQWFKGRCILIHSPELEDFSLDEEEYDDHILYKEGSSGEGYFLEFDTPIEMLRAIKKIS